MSSSACSLNNENPVAQTCELTECLKTFGAFGSEAKNQLRARVMTSLQDMFQQWLRDEAEWKLMPADVVENIRGIICPFGSYSLGVQDDRADIEAVCLAPRDIFRTNFRDHFLMHLDEQPQVKNLRCIESSRVPLLRMTFEGVEVDLAFCRLDVDNIPEAIDLLDEKWLENINISCLRSINGARVNLELLRVVPDVQTYRLTLRAIRLWAKRRGIYSSKLGYLGGGSWAILVATTCLRYPDASPPQQVCNFFIMYHDWDWTQPIQLEQTVSDKEPGGAALTIVNPVYPYHNTTEQVTSSTLRVVVEELHVGYAVTQKIVQGEGRWELLFEESEFIPRYDDFLVVRASAYTEKDHLQWSELVESRIRPFASRLNDNWGIDATHVSTTCYKSMITRPMTPEPKTSDECDSQDSGDKETKLVPCSTWVIGLILTEGLELELSQELVYFYGTVGYDASLTDMQNKGIITRVRHMRRDELQHIIGLPVDGDSSPLECVTEQECCSFVHSVRRL